MGLDSCSFSRDVRPTSLQGEHRGQLMDLDDEALATLPKNQRTDISYKSSATPVRFVFELPVPVETAGAHVSYR